MLTCANEVTKAVCLLVGMKSQRAVCLLVGMKSQRQYVHLWNEVTKAVFLLVGMKSNGIISTCEAEAN